MSRPASKSTMHVLRASPLPGPGALRFSPWFLVGSALILGLAIAFWAVKNTRLERENMVRNLVERAGALMWAMEGGARAGMGMQSTASYLQFMLEETAKQPDIVYMAVITRSGEIVAHSDRTRIGQMLYPPEGMRGMGLFPYINWRVLRTRDKERIFEAWRLFAPLPGFHMGGHRGMGRMMSGRMHGMRHGAWGDQAPPVPPPAVEGRSFPVKTPFPERGPGVQPPVVFEDHGPLNTPFAGIQPPPKAAPGAAENGPEEGETAHGSLRAGASANDLAIVIGLDLASYDSAVAAGERNTLFTALLVGLLGLGGFISLYWAQSYNLSRRMLLDTRAYAEEVMASLPLGLVMFSPEDRVVQTNAAAEKLLGRSAAELLGRPMDAVQGRDWLDVAARLRLGETVLEEEHNLEPPPDSEAKAVPVSLSASRIINEEGRDLGLLFLLRDLREVQRLRAELRKSERLSTLGNMAARVAHEIRNPLSSIKGFATYLGSRLSSAPDNRPAGGDDPTIREAAQTIISEVDRLNRVVSELLDFARPANLAIAPCDLSSLLERAVRLAAMDAEGKGVSLRLIPPAAPLSVAVDAERITQALLNLLLNAVQATPAGGSVTLAAQAEKDRALLTLSDTGRGMAPEILAQVFNPYFTTRAQGTGLGLSIVARIIEDHQGEIKLESEPGQGTVVTVWLPLAPPEEGEKEDAA